MAEIRLYTNEGAATEAYAAEMDAINKQRIRTVMGFMDQNGMTRAEVQAMINNMDFNDVRPAYNYKAFMAEDEKAERVAKARSVMGLPAENTKK